MKKEFTEGERSYFRTKTPGPGRSDVIGDLHRAAKQAGKECLCCPPKPKLPEDP